MNRAKTRAATAVAAAEVAQEQSHVKGVESVASKQKGTDRNVLKSRRRRQQTGKKYDAYGNNNYSLL